MEITSVQSNDPGDETQRNFRYQNAYGVILLTQAVKGAKPYTAIWCEHHEDLLAECNDGTLDAYQIKTQRPEEDLWSLKDEPLWKSIKRFVSLYKSFQDRIRNYFFVSNVDFPKPSQFRDSVKPGKYANNPTALIYNIHSISNLADLDLAFIGSYKQLAANCDCSEEELFTVLRLTHLVLGPSRQDFDAVIAHEHLGKLEVCSKLFTRALNVVRDELVMKIYQASSLYVDDPDRHTTPVFSQRHVHPEINAKRIAMQTVFEVIASVKQRAHYGLFAQKKDFNVIYICHSSPADDEFARWLAYQLINAGYPVWNRLISIEPGAAFEDVSREAIQHRAGKFLFVVTQNSLQDSNTLDQMQSALERVRGDESNSFIIPIEFGASGSNTFFLKKILPISFSESWAQGMKALLHMLDSEDFPKNAEAGPSLSNKMWSASYDAEQGVFIGEDEYLSNWFKIEKFPETIKFHTLKRISGIGAVQVQVDRLPYAALQHNLYLVTFAEASDFSNCLGNLIISNTDEISTKDFLKGNYDHRFVAPKYGKKFVIQLINHGWTQFVSKTQLAPHQMANGKMCYYYHQGIGDSMISFPGFNQKRSRRSLWGYKTVLGVGGIKQKKYWHYAISGKAISYPEFFLLIKAHVLFSDNGIQIWDSKPKLHAARRSWCNNWWNPQWRDRMLAMMHFLANQQENFKLPVGSNVSVVVHARPVTFLSPVSYVGPKDHIQDDEEEDTEVLDLDLLEEFPFDEEYNEQ